MTTTRRLSGMQQGAGHQSTSLMLETYEAFKRKHLSQNKEIIHKNSELHKTNADLQRQISLMRAERLSLKGTQFQLECENAALRDRLDRADDRERQLIDERDRLRRGGTAGLDPEQVEAMRKALANALAALQAFGLMLPSGYTPLPSPVSKLAQAAEPESPLAPVASTSAQPADPSTDPNSNISLSRRRSLAARAARPSMVTPPDLSNISEGGSSAEDEVEIAGGSWGREILPEMHASSSTSAALPAPAPPAPTASTSAAGHPSPLTSPTPPPPSLTRPSRAPRAPPKAPSAASHDSLAASSAGASVRPKRRVSGMLRPGLASAGRSEFGMPEEEEAEGEGEGPAAAEEEEYVPAARAPAPATVQKSVPRAKRRASSVIGPPVLLPPAGGRATRSGRTPTPEPTPTPLPQGEQIDAHEETPMSMEEQEEAPRLALREIQPAPPTPSIVPSTAGKGKGKAKAVPAALEQTEEEPPLSSSRGSALLKAKKDALRRERAAAAPAPVEDDNDDEAETSASSRAAEETLTGPRSRARGQRRVEELEPLDEEGAGSQTSEQAEESAGGRRARKSVNYALPKLNTKMRRPEDYVPVIKHVAPSAHAKPRKSTKAPSSSSSATSSSSVPPPPIPPADTPAPRPASLAGKKPRVSPALEAEQHSPTSSSSEEDDDDGDAWSEQQFLRRTSSARPSSAAGQEIDERRRARQALSAAAAGTGKGASGSVARRHSVAV